MFELTFLGVFAAGLLSFLSPCILPIVPFYLSYLAGVGVNQVGAGGVRIGALATVAQLAASSELRAAYPALAEAAESIASPQVRSQATVAGNLCQRPRCWYYRNEETVCLKKGGDECFSWAGLNKYNAILGGGPSYIVHPSDLATALVALDATVVTDRRSVAAGEFFTLPADADVSRENVLAPDELITSIELGAPRAPAWRSTYVKFKERESFDFAVAAVALALRMDGGRIAEARVVLGGVAPTPWRCPSTETLLVGRAIDASLGQEAGEDALRGAEPLEFNGYKIPLTKALVARALASLA